MKTWHYIKLAVDVGEEGFVSSDIRKLEDAGMEGWELVSMAPITISIDGYEAAF
jgi:hypothetical protein